MIRATAPGKLILAGEHAAVYGRPALVAATGTRSAATIEVSDSTEVCLELPDVAVEETTSWQDIADYGSLARQAWLAYRDDPGPDSLAALATGDPAHVVRIALAETVRALEVAPATGLRLHVTSELPVGAGFGSSASVAVATIGAVAMHLVRQVEDALVERVALEVERRQHGLPSGADHATVLYGGVQWFERGTDERLARRTLAFDRRTLARLRVFHTGVPADSTGEVVEGVRRSFAGRSEELDEILAVMEEDVRGVRRMLASGAEGPRSFCELISSYESCLERLGVVPNLVRSSIRGVEAAGGAAKISGAGALSGDAAGALLAYPPAGGEDTGMEALESFEELGLVLGGAGLELELKVESMSA